MKSLSSIFLLIITLMMIGCSGGGTASTPNNGSIVHGVAATGSPLVGTVYLKDASNPAQELSKTIAADGSFSFDVTGLTKPFLLKAVGTSSGVNYTLYSIVIAPGTANINPLSHMAAMAANSGQDLASLYNNLTPSTLQAIQALYADALAAVVAKLKPLFDANGISIIDPVGGAYVANHEGLDALFDLLIFIINGTDITITNRTNSAIIYTSGTGDILSGTINISNIPTLTGANTELMGGAIQGKALLLNGGVTTASATPGMYSGITTDGTNLYFTNNHSICMMNISTKVITTLAGNANISGTADGIGTAVRFNYPYDLTTDGTNLYVADSMNSTIRKIVIATGAVTTLAGKAGIFGSTDGIGTAATFSEPESITTDGTNLYVADYGNYTIRKIVLATGAVTTIAGSAGSPGSLDGVGSTARFKSIGGITTDGTNLYVTESGAFLGVNNFSEAGAVRKIVIATGAVSTLAGSGTQAGAVDGIGATAQFHQPMGITTDGTFLYVVDRMNYMIRKIVISTGAVTTIAGAAGITGSTDGVGTIARFIYPNSITTDGNKLYVTDGGVNTGMIRMIQ